MYIIITTAKDKTYQSNHFNSLWAANMIAFSFVKNYKEVTRADVVNRVTGEIEKIYIK